TGGVVVVLGPVGRNVGAGMTGGRAYVLDEAGVLDRQINADSVQTAPLSEPEAEELRALLVGYHEATGSHRAQLLLRRWPRVVHQFRAVRPRSAAEVPVQVPARSTGAARRAR
ncbi:MAG: hypothetical protein C4303_06205, partial [candidate division GAL15 bacterium]